MSIKLLSTLAITLLISASAFADGRLKQDKSVRWSTDKSASIDLEVGPIFVGEVDFSVNSSESSNKRSFVRRMKGNDFGDTHSSITASFDAENPKEDEWVLTVVIELVDKNGKVIDRFEGDEDLEGQAKTVEINRQILSYVIPLIHTVNIEFTSRLD